MSKARYKRRKSIKTCVKQKVDRSNSIHNKHVITLYTLIKNNPRIDKYYIGKEYELGECDLLTKNYKKDIYYEIKTNDSKHQRSKALDQLLRWSDYCYRHDKSKKYYGYYVTSRTAPICFVVNGKYFKNNYRNFEKYRLNTEEK